MRRFRLRWFPKPSDRHPQSPTFVVGDETPLPVRGNPEAAKKLALDSLSLLEQEIRIRDGAR